MTAPVVVPPVYGDPRLPARFWRFVDPSGPHGCWLWMRSRNPGGYGKTRWDGRDVLAHRRCWEALMGPVPEGQVLRHSCDTPACVNPGHLQMGTHLDNAQDCSRRGRAAGTGRGKNRLTPDLVRQIRSMAAAGTVRAVIAAAVGVSPRNVWYVLSGKTWGHVTDEASAGGAP